jgi:TfoX/Sxy family transcriptional regulator of competence genes
MKKKQERKGDGVDPKFSPVVAAFANDPHVSQKRMFSSSNVLNVSGKIFAMLVKDKLVVKLPKGKVDELVRTGKGEYFDPGHGRLMKEWVAVGAGKASWVTLAKEAYRFVKGDKS